MIKILKKAEKAYEVGEVAVGCLFVKKISELEFEVIIKGHNRTMDTKNVICQILVCWKK